MLIELLVTCVLAEGQKFTPPEHWTVREVRAYDSSWICGGGSCLAIHAPDHPLPTTVQLARSANLGESIAAPPGCQNLEAKAGAEGGTGTP